MNQRLDLVNASKQRKCLKKIPNENLFLTIVTIPIVAMEADKESLFQSIVGKFEGNGAPFLIDETIACR